MGGSLPNLAPVNGIKAGEWGWFVVPRGPSELQARPALVVRVSEGARYFHGIGRVDIVVFFSDKDASDAYPVNTVEFFGDVLVEGWPNRGTYVQAATKEHLTRRQKQSLRWRVRNWISLRRAEFEAARERREWRRAKTGG